MHGSKKEMRSKRSSEKRAARFVRTKQRQRTPDFVRKAGPHQHVERTPSAEEEINTSLDEWYDTMLHGIEEVE